MARIDKTGDVSPGDEKTGDKSAGHEKTGQEKTGHDSRGHESAGALVRRLVRSAWKGALASVERNAGHPYASLVATATAADSSPLLLLSGLAEHTRNIAADARASLLFDGTDAGRAALTGPRVTLVGRIEEARGETDRARYLSRHPDAAQFIDFGDFKLYRLDVEWAHMVAGFGRIVRLDRADVILAIDDAAEVIAAETGVLEHMNGDHSDAVALMAAAELSIPVGAAPPGAEPGAAGVWQMIGCDPDGVDITDGVRAVRVRFPNRVSSVEQVRKSLIMLVDAARARQR